MTKNKWPCPGQPEALAGQPIGMYHCEFCGEMQLAGASHLPPQFPSQWEPPFPSEEPPQETKHCMLRVLMRDGRVFKGELFDKSYDSYKHEGWFSLAIDHIEHPEVPEVFLFEECSSVVDIEKPTVNLLAVWTGEQP